MHSTIRTIASPSLEVDANGGSKDDCITPTTPQRLSGPYRGLSLQYLGQDPASPSTTRLNTASKLEPSISFGSSILPRRTRGLDFSRACTNLHHSTLAESSPDSSPVVGAKGMAAPRRSGSGYDSPLPVTALWSTAASERALGTSIGSNAMDTSDSSESDEDLMREEEDQIHMTPQPIRTSFALTTIQSPGFNPLASSSGGRRLADFARRLRIKTRKKLPIAESPGNLSPPISRSTDMNGFFGAQSRRESLNLGAGQLNLSDDIPQDALGLCHPQVVRRTVTRRSNMLVSRYFYTQIKLIVYSLKQKDLHAFALRCKKKVVLLKPRASMKRRLFAMCANLMLLQSLVLLPLLRLLTSQQQALTKLLRN